MLIIVKQRIILFDASGKGKLNESEICEWNGRNVESGGTNHHMEGGVGGKVKHSSSKSQKTGRLEEIASMLKMLTLSFVYLP